MKRVRQRRFNRRTVWNLVFVVDYRSASNDVISVENFPVVGFLLSNLFYFKEIKNKNFTTERNTRGISETHDAKVVKFVTCSVRKHKAKIISNIIVRK